MAEKKHLILAEDQLIFRNGLQLLLENSGPYLITGAYSNGLEFIRDFPFRDSPDLLILDLDMPEFNGVELLKWMNEQKVEIPTLLLTHEEDEDLIIDLFCLGVRGYLHKSCSSEMLLDAIDQILTTGFYRNDIFMRTIKKPKRDPFASPLDNLSEREMELLKLVCHPDEYTYDMIAQIMRIGRRTVDNYRESLFDKYGIRSKTGLVLFAIKTGIVKLKKSEKNPFQGPGL